MFNKCQKCNIYLHLIKVISDKERIYKCPNCNLIHEINDVEFTNRICHECNNKYDFKKVIYKKCFNNETIEVITFYCSICGEKLSLSKEFYWIDFPNNS